MDPRALYPTCVLKVNLGCCQACVVRLKKLLSNIDGVYEFNIDVENKLVTVTGKAHPQLLVEKIRQKKKKAEVLSYEKPTQNKDDSNKKKSKENGSYHQKKKNKENGNGNQKCKGKDCFCLYDDCDSHEFEDYVPPKPDPADTCKDPYCRIHHQKTIIHPNDSMSMAKLPSFLPPRPQFHLPPPRFLPPPPPVPHYARVYREEYPEDRYRFQHIEPIVYDRPLPQYDPCYYQRPPPPLPPHYGYYGARHAYNGPY